MDKNTTKDMLGHLVRLGRTFSGDKSFSELFTGIMENIRQIVGAEGGSLYIYDRATETLKIVVLTNEVLGINKVVESFDPLRIEGFIEVPMRDGEGKVNLKNPSVCCFYKKQKVMVSHLDDSEEFDFTKTRDFDKANNYKTRNLAVFPLHGHADQVIGVLQIINSNDNAFSSEMQPFVDAFTGQIAIALNNALLVSEAQNLMAAIVQMVAVAIDEKSPHTAGHCERVTALTLMIADELELSQNGHYADFSMNPEQRKELQIAAMLHDIGKIITPIHIMEKPTKLYTPYDRINVLHERLRSWHLSDQLRQITENAQAAGQGDVLKTDTSTFENDFNFLNTVNRGELFVDEEVGARLQEIAQRPIHSAADDLPDKLIKQEEYNNLQIQRGTLNDNERKIMQDHVSASIRLLSSIPWPSYLSRVVEFAGSHHEHINGGGYPHGLTGEDLSLPSRILGMADRFEAISAPDRPYRSVKMTMSRVMKIMQSMADSEEIDGDLFDFFKEQKIYMAYANRFLPPELIDCN